jgi:hypothetical protein
VGLGQSETSELVREPREPESGGPESAIQSHGLLQLLAARIRLAPRGEQLAEVAAELRIARLEIDTQSQQAFRFVQAAAPALDEAEDVTGDGVRRTAREHGATGRFGLCESAGLQVAGGGLELRVHRSASLPDPPLLASQKKRRPVLGTGRRP